MSFDWRWDTQNCRGHIWLLSVIVLELPIKAPHSGMERHSSIIWLSLKYLKSGQSTLCSPKLHSEFGSCSAIWRTFEAYLSHLRMWEHDTLWPRYSESCDHQKDHSLVLRQRTPPVVTNGFLRAADLEPRTKPEHVTVTSRRLQRDRWVKKCGDFTPQSAFVSSLIVFL